MLSTEKSIIPYTKLPHIRYFLMDTKSRSIHMHDAYELLYVLDGEVTIWDDSKEYIIKKGDVFLLNSDSLHSLFCSSGRVLLLNLHLSPQFANEYIPNLKNIKFSSPVPAESPEKLIGLMLAGAYTYFVPRDEKHKCLALTYMTLSEMLKIFPNTERTDNEFLSQMHISQRMQDIVKYMEANIAEPRLLQKTAEHEGLSPTYLSRLFSDYFNITFQQFLKQQRIEKALKLLNSTNLPVYDICFECGFQDYRQLNRYCKENFGKTASECRGASLSKASDSDNIMKITSNEYRYSDEETYIYLSRIKNIDAISI